MRKKTLVLVALVATAPALTACGSSGGPGSGSGSGTSIDITVKGGTVTPNGERVKAKVDEPITLHIDADTSGEIHVHSTPEREIAFDKGKSTKMITISQPGIVDVEDHALHQVIVQLQVS
jgi:hypothetical protein